MAGFFKNLFKDKDKPQQQQQQQQRQQGAPQQQQQQQQQPPQQASGALQATIHKFTREDFEEILVLGKGSFAKVVLARHTKTGEYFALKVIDKKLIIDHKRENDAIIERNVMMRLPHRYILRLHGTFQSEHKLFFVLGFMAGGDFDKYLNGLPNKILDFETSRLYAAEVFLAMTHLHRNGVIYRDLKPENIMMSREGHLVLADFGLSKDFGGEGGQMVAQSFVGSPFYVAPDVLKQQKYNEAVDFWSFGVLLYRMIYGRPPFSGRNMREVFDAIMKVEVRFPTSFQVAGDHHARDLILKLLQKDPAKRANEAFVRQHPFWEGLNLDAVAEGQIAPKAFPPPMPIEQFIAMHGGQGEGSKQPALQQQGGTGAQPVMRTAQQDSAALSDQQQSRFEDFSSAQ